MNTLRLAITFEPLYTEIQCGGYEKYRIPWGTLDEDREQMIATSLVPILRNFLSAANLGNEVPEQES